MSGWLPPGVTDEDIDRACPGYYDEPNEEEEEPMDKPNDKPKNGFTADLAKAQAKMKHAVLDKTNPHFHSRYASLASVIDATVPHLAAVGIVVKQRVVLIEDGLFLKTWLEHPSGEPDEPSYWPIAPGTAQQMGSGLTYARRYGLSCVAGVAAEEDDDGEAASAPPKKSAYRARKDETWPPFEKGLREQTSLEGLKAFWEEHKEVIREWPPAWAEQAHEEKDRCKQKLIEEASEDTELKQQLKGSLV